MVLRDASREFTYRVMPRVSRAFERRARTGARRIEINSGLYSLSIKRFNFAARSNAKKDFEITLEKIRD